MSDATVASAPDELAHLLSEFSSAASAPPPQPAGPSPAEVLEQVQQRNAEVMEQILAGRNRLHEHYRPLAEAFDAAQADLEHQAMIAEAKERHGLSNISDDLIGAALGDERALNALSEMNANYKSHAARGDLEAALAAVSNTSFDRRDDASEISPRQLMQMSDREYAAYKESAIERDRDKHEAWKRGYR